MSYKEHFQEELKYMGWANSQDEMTQHMIENVEELLIVLETQEHSGFSHAWLMHLFTKIANFEPLSQLTGSDDEWHHLGEGKYQNKRKSAIFKQENGQAYWLDGYIFREECGSCFTNFLSRKYITFPYSIEKSKYIDLPSEYNDEIMIELIQVVDPEYIPVVKMNLTDLIYFCHNGSYPTEEI